MINILMIVAIISGPIVAVQVQKLIERLKASILMKENGVFNVKNKHLSSFC